MCFEISKQKTFRVKKTTKRQNCKHFSWKRGFVLLTNFDVFCRLKFED
jgi:hypothetical protein